MNSKKQNRPKLQTLFYFRRSRYVREIGTDGKRKRNHDPRHLHQFKFDKKSANWLKIGNQIGQKTRRFFISFVPTFRISTLIIYRMEIEFDNLLNTTYLENVKYIRWWNILARKSLFLKWFSHYIYTFCFICGYFAPKFFTLIRPCRRIVYAHLERGLANKINRARNFKSKDYTLNGMLPCKHFI